jgi:predicted transcriptional regulator
MLRHNTFAGATATVGAHENVKTPTIEQFQKSIAQVNKMMVDWEAQFQAFAVAHGCDLEAGSVLVVPEAFDLRDVPPRFRPQVIRKGADFGLLRNPTGSAAVTPE